MRPNANTSLPLINIPPLHILLQERLVLAILYYEMSGDQWYDNTNWLTPTHHRRWYGVGYTNYVDELDLNSSNLISSIPAQISILTSLTYLSFSNKKSVPAAMIVIRPTIPRTVYLLSLRLLRLLLGLLL